MEKHRKSSLDGFEGWRLRFCYQNLPLEFELIGIRLNFDEISMETLRNLSLDGFEGWRLRFYYQNSPLECESRKI